MPYKFPGNLLYLILNRVYVWNVSYLNCSVLSFHRFLHLLQQCFKTFWRTLLSRMSSSCAECAAVVMHQHIIKCKSRSSNMTYIPIKIFASNQGYDTPWQMPFQCLYIGRRGQKSWQYFNLHVLCTSGRNCNAYCSYNSFHQKYLWQPYKIITIQHSWKKPKPMYFNCHWKSHWKVQNDKKTRQQFRKHIAKRIWIHVIL